MIIDKNDLEVWMISLIDNDIADLLRDITIPKWENEGFKVNLFNAITPDTMLNVSPQLKFGMKDNVDKNPIEFTGTEMAIWYSHLYLWKKCVIANRPFLIIEEDPRPIKKVPSKFKVADIFYLARCGSAYIIRPFAAELRVKNALKRTLTYNVDCYIAAKRKIDISKFCAEPIEREMRSVSHN